MLDLTKGETYVHPKTQQCSIPLATENAPGLMSASMVRKLESFSPKYVTIDENTDWRYTNGHFTGLSVGASRFIPILQMANSITLAAYAFVKVSITLTFSAYKSGGGTPIYSDSIVFMVGDDSSRFSSTHVVLRWSGGTDWDYAKTATMSAVYYLKGSSRSVAYVDYNDPYGNYANECTRPLDIGYIAGGHAYNTTLNLTVSGSYKVSGVET